MLKSYFEVVRQSSIRTRNINKNFVEIASKKDGSSQENWLIFVKLEDALSIKFKRNFCSFVNYALNKLKGE